MRVATASVKRPDPHSIALGISSKHKYQSVKEAEDVQINLQRYDQALLLPGGAGGGNEPSVAAVCGNLGWVTALLCLSDDWFDDMRGAKEYCANAFFFALTAVAALYLEPFSPVLFAATSVAAVAAIIAFLYRPGVTSKKILAQSKSASNKKALIKDIVWSGLYLLALAVTTAYAGPWYVVFMTSFTAALALVDDVFDERRQGRHYGTYFFFFVATLAAALYLAPHSLWYSLAFDAAALVVLVGCRRLSDI